MSVPVYTIPAGDPEFERQGEPWWRITLRAIDRFARLLTMSEWAFAALLIFSYAYFLTPSGTNTVSRYDMVYALAHGVANIDLHASNTIDVSYFRGHWYSPRSLGLSLLATPMLIVVGHFFDLDNYARLGLTVQIALLNAFTLLPATVAGALAFRRFVVRLRPSLDGSPLPYVVTGMFALGTLAYPFSTTFYSHMFGGSLIFIAFYLLFTARWMLAPQRRIALAGLLTGVAVISEYPVGVIMLLLGGYILLAFPLRRIQALLIFVAGITPSALLLGWYNWWAFGDPFNLSYAFVSGNQFAGQHTGFFGITVPTLPGLWDVLVYPRGLLVESPFLILVPLGLARWYRSRGPYHLEALMAIAVSIIYPLIVSAYFLPMAGENLPGPRLVTPMLAFSCLSLAWVVDDHRVWLRRFLVAAMGVGVAVSFLYVALGVRIDHTYGAYPISDLYWPLINSGVVPARNGPHVQNLGELWLHLPHTWSLALAAIPLALWVYAAAKAMLPVAAPALSAALSEARADDAEPALTPAAPHSRELAATR